MLITVAIPVRDGGQRLVEVIEAVQRQTLPHGVECELVACDSGSRDGSVEAIRARGVEVFEIAPESFSHGATRNLLMERSQGELVAFLTQDSVPAGDDWLAKLTEPFSTVDRLGLAFGPYIARSDASPMVRRELSAWFASLSPNGGVRIDRLGDRERSSAARDLYGARGFFTDANGCVSRAAWSSVPFRQVAYAEDQALALDMLRAGYGKAFVPSAAVIHSHDYAPLEWVRRSFDEARALDQVYALADLGDLRRLARGVRGSVAADVRGAGGPQATGAGLLAHPTLLGRSLSHHGARALGTALGARADRLPPALVRRLSLERRA